MEEIRIQIIKDILDSFGVFNYNVVYPMARGESLAEYLKNFCVIYPNEYDAFLTANSSNIGEFVDSLNGIVTTVRNKKRMYEIYERYCMYFLGEFVSYDSLISTPTETRSHLNLRDENGLIDYKPYLEALGITDLEHISDQYPGKGR